MLERGADEAAEERVGFIGFALEFGMILASEKEGMAFEFDELGQGSIGRGAADKKAFVFHLLAVVHVELVAMPMSL